MLRLVFAFCGFYVAAGGEPLVNDATQVVMMRHGTRTVLAMQNSYQGPPEQFALVVPVPAVLHEGDVKTLPREVFTHVELMGAPRLVEYWEQDPCDPRSGMDMSSGGDARPMEPDDKVTETKELGVKVEARFVVGEYQIVILSAKDSTGLDTWLRQEKYNIPAGAAPLLRPYVESGMKFFVAKVDPQKVKLESGRAVLSPLRFHYDADELALPIRLGLANSAGTQDLIVSIFAPNQRYAVANYPNVTIPTNLDVKDSVKDHFASFYAALFDRTLETHKGAVVTEYAWQATSCDPCPGPTLDVSELAILGADVLAGPRDQPQRYDAGDFVLTRLHARYGKDVTRDLVFQQAPPIVGGREFVQAGGKLEDGAHPAEVNNFQARYAIRHAWTGPLTCTSPKRGVWGGPTAELAQPVQRPRTAVDLAVAPRGLTLAAALTRDLPEIGLAIAAPPPAAAPATPAPAAARAKSRGGCGCETSDPAGLALAVGVLGLIFHRPGSRRRRLDKQ